MKHSNIAGGVIIGPKGLVAVVNQHGSSWSLPKGHVEMNESLSQAATREIEEETGLTELVFLEELGTYDRYRIAKDGSDDKSELKTITLFLYKTSQDELQPKDPDNPSAIWVDLDKVSGLLTNREDAEFFKSKLSKIQTHIN